MILPINAMIRANNRFTCNMMAFYWAPDTGAFIVHAALETAGAEYTLHEIDYEAKGHKQESFLAINPEGKLPALVLADGTVLTESVAIVIHIADLYPDGALLPPVGSSQRAEAYRWMLFMATNTYGNDMRYYYSERYTTDPEGAAGVRQAAAAQMDGDFDYMDSVLGNRTWLAGETPTVADAYLAMVSMWHWDVPALLDRCGNIERVIRGVRSRPGIQEIWARNFPEAPPFLV